MTGDIAAIAERMRNLCTLLRTYTPKSQWHLSFEIVEKWAAAIDECLKRETE
jgi:hypothetical protein